MPKIKQEYALNVAEKAKDLRKRCDNMVKGLEAWCGVGVDVDMLDNALGDVHKGFLMMEHAAKLARSKAIE